MLGALIGDIVGSRFEFNNIKTKNFQLFHPDCLVTDDSVMSVAVAEMCLKGFVPNNKDGIIKTFKKWGKKYPYAGYGSRFINWVLSNDINPYYSCGNGSAMRISAIGFYANTEEEVKLYSKSVTEVTHNHPEGLKGAEVTAMCIFMAKKGKTKEEIASYVKQYYDINFDYEYLKQTYVHGQEICQITVPQAIYCFLISNSFKESGKVYNLYDSKADMRDELVLTKKRFQRLNIFLNQMHLKTIDDAELALLKAEFADIIDEKELPF